MQKDDLVRSVNRLQCELCGMSKVSSAEAWVVWDAKSEQCGRKLSVSSAEM